MKVTAKIKGPFIYTAGFIESEVDLVEPVTTEDLIFRVSIDKDRSKIILHNGKAVTLSDALTDGDSVVISPIYSGG